MSAVRDALEALGHTAGALPEPRLLADLFVRFQTQVPLRRAAEGAGAVDVLAAWLEDGAGCCGESRVRAFESLAVEAGFSVEPALALGASGQRRRLLLASGRRLLLDPAFPLPAAVSLDPPAEADSTGYGTLSVRSLGADRFAVLLSTRGDERELYRVEPGEAPRETAARDAGAEARAGELFRLLDDRLLRWRDGVLEVSDAWSRFRLPLPAADADGLEALFGPPLPGPREFGVPEAGNERALAEPTLAVYHGSTETAASLRGLLADPEVHAALLPDGWTVEDLALRGDGFTRTLVEEGAPLRTERFAIRPDGITVEAEGPLALFRTRTWTLEPRPSGTRLRILATLRDPVPPRGLPEGARRRLVFELASELLALDAQAAAG